MEKRTPDPQFQVYNTSDKFGNVLRTRNMDFDLQGYARLSPRMARLYSEVENSDFKLPLAIASQTEGVFQILTAKANFGANVTVITSTVLEDSGTHEPTTSLESDAVWFNGLWHASTDTKVLSRPPTGGASETWTEQITGLTSGYMHVLSVNKSRVQLCVSNGNTVSQYDTSYATSALTRLTIPADYEVVGMAYNNGYMGITTRVINDGTKGNDQEAMFYYWRGASTEAQVAVGLGSDAGIAIIPYKSSFVVITRSGELKYFNGSGFQSLGAFPFYFLKNVYGSSKSTNALGKIFGIVDGERIFINIGNGMDRASRDKSKYVKHFPAGVWCYDPSVGLYHRYSPSNSPFYVCRVTAGDVNTGTDVLTISSGTVPVTGNIARLINSAGIGGLEENQDYYIIKTGTLTFKLAETREQALEGVSIDITSATAGNNYFLMVDHVDYGITAYSYPGAISKVGDPENNYPVLTDIIAGARVDSVAGASTDMASMCIPWMENIGAIETTPYQSEVRESGTHEVNVRFKPLNDTSSIVVYSRTQDVYGLPVATVGDRATWLGANTLSTLHDLRDAETYMNGGGSLLMEILSGAGAGNFVPVRSVTCDSGTCSVELDNDVFGVTSGNVCDFIIENYKQEFTITSDNNDDGYVDVALDLNASKFAQFLILLVGNDITLEAFNYKNTPHK